jgi:hypothetical protein
VGPQTCSQAQCEAAERRLESSSMAFSVVWLVRSCEFA